MPAHDIRDLLRERILILDGAMGTMIQRHRLDEGAFRGERFKGKAGAAPASSPLGQGGRRF